MRILTLQKGRRPRGFFWIIVIIVVAVVILAILASLRDSHKTAAEKASEYLELSRSDQNKVRKELSAAELRELDKAIDELRNPPPPPAAAPVTAPTSAPAPDPVAAPVTAPTSAPAPPSAGLPPNEGPVAFNPELPPGDYLDRLFRGELDTHSQLYIPGYAYFQGVVGSGGPVTVAGQVRVIGGASGSSGKLQNGAMVTTAPDYLEGRVTPSRNRFRVTEWKELP